MAFVVLLSFLEDHLQCLSRQYHMSPYTSLDLSLATSPCLRWSLTSPAAVSANVPWLPWTLLGCSGSPPLLFIVAYWIDLLSRVFRSKTKWSSHGWPISAVPFNSVVKCCWLSGLVSTVYKKVLCKKSPFSNRPVWHQCQDDLLLESLITQLCCYSVWVSLATSLSYSEPKIPHCAGGKSVCRHVFLINDFSGWFLCSACRCHYGKPMTERCGVPLLLTSIGSIVYEKAALAWLSTELSL